MKRSTGLFVFCAVMFATGVKAADDMYGGVHFTVPFTFDAVGVHAIFRDNYGEVRAGIDTRGVWQAGAGFSAGESDSVVGSAGIAFSSYQGRAVGYVGLRGGPDQYEYGVVSYGAEFATTYGLVGAKLNWDDDDNGGSAPATVVDRPDDKVVDDGDTGSDGGDATGGRGDTGPVDNGSGGDSGHDGGGSGDNDSDPVDHGTGGDDDGGGNDDRGNRSGLGDGTNPGKGKGRDNSPNTGTGNPNKADR